MKLAIGLLLVFFVWPIAKIIEMIKEDRKYATPQWKIEQDKKMYEVRPKYIRKIKKLTEVPFLDVGYWCKFEKRSCAFWLDDTIDFKNDVFVVTKVGGDYKYPYPGTPGTPPIDVKEGNSWWMSDREFVMIKSMRTGKEYPIDIVSLCRYYDDVGETQSLEEFRKLKRKIYQKLVQECAKNGGGVITEYDISMCTRGTTRLPVKWY